MPGKEGDPDWLARVLSRNRQLYADLPRSIRDSADTLRTTPEGGPPAQGPSDVT